MVKEVRRLVKTLLVDKMFVASKVIAASKENFFFIPIMSLFDTFDYSINDVKCED